MQLIENRCHILFTSVGRRVSLIRQFQKALTALNLKWKIVGIDITDSSPAFHIVHKAYKTCQIEDPHYIDELLDICKKEKIDLLFPLIDTDLEKLSINRDAFALIGTNVVISDPNVIKIAMDKHRTYDFFVANGIDTPRVVDIEAALHDDALYPLFIKPLDGNASKGTFRLNGKRDLSFFKDYVQRPILQELVMGNEHTLDVFFDFYGNVRCVVPRQRLEVRAGEVSKGLVVNDKRIIEAGWRVGSCLQGGRGCINIQCFLTPEGKIRFVEINPRFGGGTPLSIEAGANFPRWIIQMAMGIDPGDISNSFKNNFAMYRYDDAVFLDINAPPREKIVVYGAGGHAKVVIDTLEQTNNYEVAYILDDNVDNKSLFSYPILGGREALRLPLKHGITTAIVAVGDNETRAESAKLLCVEGYKLATIIHPDSLIARNVRIGAGSVVFAKSIINSGTVIGKNCIINTNAIIEHDNVIGDNVHISPRAVLGGEVTVGKNSHIGMGATIINTLTVGENTLIGAGSVVTRNIPNNVVAFGSPAKIRRPHLTESCI